MKEELEKDLFNSFDELYRGRDKGIDKNLMSFGFACGNGWHDIVYKLSNGIVTYCKENGYDIPEVFQVKEKFGQLKFYTQGYYDEEIKKMIREAEQKSVETCEICGSEGEIREGSWIKTLCDEHAKEQGYIE